MIEIKELTFKYSGSKKNALENVSLTIEKGDFVGLIGESTRCPILEVIPEIRFPMISFPQLNALETILENTFFTASNTPDRAFLIFPTALLTPDTILANARENPFFNSSREWLVR